MASVAIAQPAQAFLGIGEGKNRTQQYEENTAEAIKNCRAVLAVSKDDPDREGKVEQYRQQAKVWVAKYRQDKSFQGRQSYQNMYSVFNALSGHYQSFGYQAPIPKKRLDVIVKEIDDAEKFLSRGR